MEERAARLVPGCAKRHKKRHEVIRVRVGTFSVRTALPILHKV